MPDKFLIGESLVIHTLNEQLVEVEVVLHQEFDIRCLELHGLVPKDVRMWPDVSIEGARNVLFLQRIPLESCNSDLERVHS